MTMPRFDATWNFGHVMIAVGMVVGGLTGGLTVYGGVIGQLTRLTLDVDRLKETAATIPAAREQQINNNASIAQLKEATSSIRDTNTKMLEQLTGIRVDIATIKAQQQRTGAP